MDSVFNHSDRNQLKILATSTPKWQIAALPNWIQNKDSQEESSEISLNVSNKNPKFIDLSEGR